VTRREALLAAAFTAVALGLATVSARPRGDSGEYVLMATAFARHLSPDLRPSDARLVAEREPALARLMEKAAAGMEAEEPVLLGSIHRSSAGRYYSFHFWFYSLLAAPLVWPVSFLGGSPVLALAFLNAAAVSVAAGYAYLTTRGARGLVHALAFLVCGTTYYLPWTGPEALTASSALVAALAAMQGRIGLALLATGVATAQNPSASALALFVVAWRSLLSRRPETALLPFAPLPALRTTVALAAGGAVLGVASPAFFGATFGEPSLIAKFTTDRSLVSGARAFSFLFDLNQGMLIGVPGLLLGLLAAAILSFHFARERSAVAAGVILACVTVGLMVTPSLSTHNWNSGCAVFMRYAYWSAMPLLAALIGIAGSLPTMVARWLTGVALVVQVAPVVLNGVTGDDVWYTRHNGLARLVMGRAPDLYNPIPEIFVERTLRRETPADHQVIVWPKKETPRKLLVLGSARARSRRLCDGGEFRAASVVDVVGGSRYLNGPFQCTGARKGLPRGARPGS
jgi:hypothetical protein